MENVEILKDSFMVESLLEILTKRRSQAFYKFIDIHYVTNVLGKIIFSINMWNIENLQGLTFLCVSVVNILKGKKLFLAQMNRYRVDLILARRYWNCSTMENLRCLNTPVSENSFTVSCKRLRLSG